MSKNIYLLISLASFVMYLKKGTEGGQTLKGKIGPWKVNPATVVDSAIPWLGLNPLTSQIVKSASKSFLEGIIGEDFSDAIDAQYRRVK
jgi:hypothetical protein